MNITKSEAMSRLFIKGYWYSISINNETFHAMYIGEEEILGILCVCFDLSGPENMSPYYIDMTYLENYDIRIYQEMDYSSAAIQKEERQAGA